MNAPQNTFKLLWQDNEYIYIYIYIYKSCNLNYNMYTINFARVENILLLRVFELTH